MMTSGSIEGDFDDFIHDNEERLIVATWNLGKMSETMSRSNAKIFLEEHEDRVRDMDIVFLQELSVLALDVVRRAFQDDFRFVVSKRSDKERLLVMVRSDLAIQINYVNVHMPRHPQRSDFEELFTHDHVNSELPFIIAGDFNRDLHHQRYQERYLKQMPNNIRIDSSQELTTASNSIDFVMYNSHFLREAEVAVFPFTPIGDEGNHFLKVVTFELDDQMMVLQQQVMNDLPGEGTDEGTRDGDDVDDISSNLMSKLTVNDS